MFINFILVLDCIRQRQGLLNGSLCCRPVGSFSSSSGSTATNPFPRLILPMVDTILCATTVSPDSCLATLSKKVSELPTVIIVLLSCFRCFRLSPWFHPPRRRPPYCRLPRWFLPTLLRPLPRTKFLDPLWESPRLLDTPVWRVPT